MTEQQQPEHPTEQDVPLTGQEAGETTQNPTNAYGQAHAPALGMQSDAGAEVGEKTATDVMGVAIGSAADAGTAPSPNTAGDGPNAAASLAAASSASDTPSSAQHASPSADMRVRIDFDSAVEAFKSIGKLRAFLWTFEAGSMRHLHAELDKLEALFK